MEYTKCRFSLLLKREWVLNKRSWIGVAITIILVLQTPLLVELIFGSGWSGVRLDSYASPIIVRNLVGCLFGTFMLYLKWVHVYLNTMQTEVVMSIPAKNKEKFLLIYIMGLFFLIAGLALAFISTFVREIWFEGALMKQIEDHLQLVRFTTNIRVENLWLKMAFIFAFFTSITLIFVQFILKIKRLSYAVFLSIGVILLWHTLILRTCTVIGENGEAVIYIQECLLPFILIYLNYRTFKRKEV